MSDKFQILEPELKYAPPRIPCVACPEPRCELAQGEDFGPIKQRRVGRGEQGQGV